MAHPHALSPRDLFKRLLSDRAPVVIDIRVPDDLAQDPGWLPASHRMAFDDLDGHLAVANPEAEIVIACHGGLKLSQGAAARLAIRGRRAAYLAGGCLAWRADGLPFMAAKPGLWAAGDEIGALWLGARLLPRPHEIMRVAPDQIVQVADRFGAQVLPSAKALLGLMDRPVPALADAAAFAASADFARLARGNAAGFATLDAWALGAVVAA